MKKSLKYTFLAFALVVSFGIAGCSDFLDLKPKGKEVPTKLEHYNGLFNNTLLINLAFSEQRPDGSISPGTEPLLMIYMGDELIADASSFASMDRTALAAYKFEADIFNEDDVSAEWNAPYQQIYTYNVIVNGVMDADDGTREEKQRFQAEARVGRAYMHFLLAQFFGKPYNESTASQDLCVPIVTKATSADRNFKRATVEEVYRFIITELEEACPQLDEQTKHKLRIYRAAGYYMLGKVYFSMGNYGKALTALKESLKATENSTVPLGLFDYNTSLAEWGYNPIMANMWGLMGSYPSNFDLNNQENICTKQYNIMTIMFAIYPPTVYVKPEYMALFGESDLRLAFFNTKDYTGTTLWPYSRRIQRITYSLGGDMPDLYLMLAECKARLDDLSGAREDLLALREKRIAGADAAIPAEVDSKDKLIRYIVEERKREFMMSGMRWFDIRRLWNDPLFQEDKQNYTHTDGQNIYTLTEDRLVFRIPPKVLSFSTDWENNK